MAVVRFALSSGDIERWSPSASASPACATPAPSPRLSHRGPDLDRLAGAARRLPRRRRLLQPRRRQPQQRPDRPLLLDGERRHRRRAHEHPTDWLTTSRTAYYPEVHGWDAIVAGDAAPSVHARKRPYLTSCPMTTIGPDVWIGQGAYVKAGVTIGPGAIVGARAVGRQIIESVRRHPDLRGVALA